MIVKNKAALVRAGPSLASDVVGELPKGTLITCGDSAFHDGIARREVLAPLKGWASAKCLADAPVLPPPPPEAGPEPPRVRAQSDAPRPPGPGPQPRLWALSDVHTDHGENLDWLRQMCARNDFRRDGLILAGDVSSRFSILRETLAMCKSAFADVSFVPGNHDIWVTRGEPWQDSLSKLRAVDALCDELGVRRTPCVMGGCVVAPLCAWHHAAFDREPEVTGWNGIPPASQVISDFYLCKFPGLSQTDDSVAAALDARNDEGAIAELRMKHPSLPLVTFSHFVPHPSVVPEKRYLFVPALAKAVGSTFLERRVASLKPDVHVFGHTHFGWDATRDGVRYVQACLAYPRERRDRLTTVAAVCCPADAPETCRPCTPFPVAPAPLLLREGGAFVPRYRCGWSAFYDVNPRRPDLTHMLPPYVAKQYSCVPGVGEVGWGEGVVTPASAMLSIST